MRKLRLWRIGTLAALLLGGCGFVGGPQPSPTPFSITTPNGRTWDLVWSDEFSYLGVPDPRKWGYERGFVRNQELQVYTDRSENARVEASMLIIEAHREDFQGGQYTSASLITKDTATWTYGRFEARARLPRGRGMWPAIWLLGANIDAVGWPLCGEIDIMENVGFEGEIIHGGVHTEAYNHMRGNARGGSLRVPGIYDDFHVYAIEWTPEQIDFYVDETLFFSYENDGSGVEAWPFDEPHYLILNLAIGGTWGGQRGVDDEAFPAQFVIDYVRVFELRE